MTGAEFTAWLQGQQSLGRTIDEIAAQLRVLRSQVYRWKKSGTSEHTDLAIAAVDAGLKERDNG